MKKIKKTLSLLLSTMIVFSSVAGVSTTVFAASDELTYRKFKYKMLDNDTAEICGYTGKDTVVTIPESINSVPVTSIGRTAFSSCKIKELQFQIRSEALSGGRFTVAQVWKKSILILA